MPRLSCRSTDSEAHRAANRGRGRQATEQRSLQRWEESPILGVDNPKGPAAPPFRPLLPIWPQLGEHACLVPSPRMKPRAAPSIKTDVPTRRRSGTGGLRRVPSKPTTRHRRDHMLAVAVAAVLHRTSIRVNGGEFVRAQLWFVALCRGSPSSGTMKRVRSLTNQGKAYAWVSI